MQSVILVQQMIADAAPAAAAPLTTVPASAAVPAMPMAEHAAEAVVAARLGAQLAAALEAQLQPILASLAAAATPTDVHRGGGRVATGVAAATQTEEERVWRVFVRSLREHAGFKEGSLRRLRSFILAIFASNLKDHDGRLS